MASAVVSKRRNRKMTEEYLREREIGFNLTGIHQDKLPRYNALLDRNLRHHFENQALQAHLNQAGMIDQYGRVVDLDKQAAKLSIIEQEFKLAELAEAKREVEENYIRRRVQMKRYESLQEARQREKLQQIKEEKRIAAEIIRASKGYSMASPIEKGLKSNCNTSRIK